MKKNIFTIIILLIVVALIGVVSFGYYKKLTHEVKNPIATIEIENYGTVKVELYPEMAPNTVKNFIKLAQNGYYNNKTFFGIDTISVYGGYNEKGEEISANLSDLYTGANENEKKIEAGSEEDFKYEIAGEFIANGFEQNTLSHEKGVISMIRMDYTSYMPNLVEESYNSANSQFSILLEDERGLNGVYAGFGKVIEGLEILESFKNIETVVEKDEEGNDIEQSEEALKTFSELPVIKTITVDTFGIDYGMPKVTEAFDFYTYWNNYYTNYLNQQ